MVSELRLLNEKVERDLELETLEENWVFVTNQFATSCDYLTFTTIVGHIYNYFLHLVLLATTL